MRRGKEQTFCEIFIHLINIIFFRHLIECVQLNVKYLVVACLKFQII
jgi:hypothetical protein